MDQNCFWCIEINEISGSGNITTKVELLDPTEGSICQLEDYPEPVWIASGGLLDQFPIMWWIQLKFIFRLELLQVHWGSLEPNEPEFWPTNLGYG